MGWRSRGGDRDPMKAFRLNLVGLEPWNGSVNCPVLCVNSEEFTLSDDQERLLRLAKTCRRDAHILALREPSCIPPAVVVADLYSWQHTSLLLGRLPNHAKLW